MNKAVWKSMFVALIAVALLANVAAAFAQAKFEDIKLIKSKDGKKAEELDAELEINKESGEILIKEKKGGATLKIAKAQVTKIVYERASKPRYAAGLLLAWPLLFTKSKKHFLTVQYKEGEKGEFALLRLDKNNYQAVLAGLEAATGVKVENLID
jgi:hypothetical protein